MRTKTAVATMVILVCGMVQPAGVVFAASPAGPEGAHTSVEPGAGGTKDVAESSSGSYIVVMKQDPLVASIPTTRLSTPQAVAQASALDAIHTEVLADAGVVEEAKVHDYTNSLNGFSAIVSHDKAIAMAANPAVALVMPDDVRHLTRESQAGQSTSAGSTQQDDLGHFLGLTGRAEAWRSGVTGEGVVVGVIDTGIWPEHPSFADDGSYKPPAQPLDSSERSACDFGDTAHNPDDAPFSCNNKLIGARQMLDTYRKVVGAEPDEFDSARDDDGHGTHTASTAAGNSKVQAEISHRPIAVISGIAPRAQIVAYKALGKDGGFTSDLAAAIDQAVADGVDVINYSVGGGAQTVTADTIAFLFAADAGVFSAVSAGNDGPTAETIGGPADVPWVTAVGANTMKRSFEGIVKLDRGPNVSGSSLTAGTRRLALVDAEAAPKAGASGAQSELCLAGTLDPAKVTGKIVLCKRGGNGRVAKSAAVLAAGGAGMVLYNASNSDNLFTDNFFLPTVHLDFSTGLTVKFYIHHHRNPMATLQTGKVTTLPYAPSMTAFSSRGPNPSAPDIIKPDITAPGIQILAGNTPFPTPGEEVPGELFQAIAGTSMSSPVVAGVYALIKQVHPDWSAAAAKSALMTTADTNVKDNDRKSKAGPFAMGSGMVDPGKPGANGSAFKPGLVYDAGFTDYLGFLCDAGPEAFQNPEATCSALSANGIPIVATGLNLSSIGVSQLAGRTTVTRTVTSVADKPVTWRAEIMAPPGYSVKVDPKRFTLRPGESERVQVTVTNTGSAKIGEWATGALTWKARTYEVRSPIAVRGVTMDVPTEVSGSGVQGSLNFDVKFGYTGPYAARAHGLVAPIDTTDQISQDPDQTYPSADDGAGVDAIPVTLTGIAHARWSLVLPGDNDLDLYLLDGTGKVVASSTNGGTDETIDVSSPPDGNYTLIVHGWAVGATPVTYTMHNWNVPAAPGGGSLVIDKAPTAATIGATASVTVSWSGLTAGTTYLGAVSHSNADGIVGLTLVDVTG
ncbi:S8 family serine peptidase [Nakamurella sp. GG22]